MQTSRCADSAPRANFASRLSVICVFRKPLRIGNCSAPLRVPVACRAFIIAHSHAPTIVVAARCPAAIYSSPTAMGRGGAAAVLAKSSVPAPFVAPLRPPSTPHLRDALSDDDTEVTSIRLQYPRSSRLLLGTTANIHQPAFFKALETRHPLEISLECHALTPPLSIFGRVSRSNLRPFALFFYRASPSDEWKLIGRTETVAHDLLHRFVTKLKVCCATMTDRMKMLRVEIYHHRIKGEQMADQLFIGSAQCTLDDIISEPLLRKQLRLESAKTAEPGSAILSADAIRPSDSSVKFALHVDMASVTKGNHRVFFVFSRQMQSGDYTPIYRSEVLGKDEKKFKPLVRELCAVTTGVDDKLLRLEVFQFAQRGAHTKLGFMQTSVDKLRTTKAHASLLWWPATSSDDDAVIEIGRVVVIEACVEKALLRFRLRVTQ